MQFKLVERYGYWWPATVRIPDSENPGKLIEQKLKVLLAPLSRDEIEAAEKESAALKTAREIADHSVRQVHKVVRDWDGVIDGNGKPVPFSTEKLDQALQFPWFRTGIMNALSESQNGQEARLGN